MIDAILEALSASPGGIRSQDGNNVGMWPVAVVYPLNRPPVILLNTDANESWVLSLERFA